MGMGPMESTAATAVEVASGGAAVARAGSYAVLQCGDDSEYVRKAYGGYFAVFRSLLAEDGERWRVYRAVRGELPEDKEAEGFDGFVISGSCSDAHGDDPWILRLVELIQMLHAMGKRLLGVCFGHQILCRALGGKTGRSRKGWDIGVTCLHPTATAARLFHPPPHMPIIEFHQDEVWELPPHAEVLARSDKTGVEMFRYGDRVMGVQGHPEYNKDILMSIADRLLQNKQIQDSQVETAKASFDVRSPDREFWKRVCRSFLKGRLQLQQQQQLVL